MFRDGLALTLLLAAHVTTVAAQPAVACDEAALGDATDTARSNIIAGTDGTAAIGAWRHVLGSGGAIAWTVTEYNVDPRSTFVFAFDREALRVYRASAFGEHVDRATGGCIDSSIPPEAVIPWRDVREIEAGNWVLWFRLREPVTIRSDRGHRKRVDELKAFFHGAGGGDLTFYYNLRREGRIPFWNVDVYKVDNLRGIAVGPTDFQRRLQFVIAQAVDPDERINMKRKGRGAGW
jgi:hypothetical protein